MWYTKTKNERPAHIYKTHANTVSQHRFLFLMPLFQKCVIRVQHDQLKYEFENSNSSISKQRFLLKTINWKKMTNEETKVHIKMILR